MFDILAYTIAAQDAAVEAPRLSPVRLEREINKAKPGALRGLAASIGRVHGLSGITEDYSGTMGSVTVGKGKAVHGATVEAHGVMTWCGAGVVRPGGGATFLLDTKSAAGAPVTCKRCLTLP